VPREGTAPPRPLQLPGGAAPKDRLGIDVVEYTAQGEVAIGGAAEPGKHVRVFLGERLIAQSKAESDGRWSAQPEAPVAPGTYTLRVEQMTSDGTVAARVSLPFQRAAITPGEGSDRSIVVQPGDNLWFIARHTYGSGFRYAVIYEANRAHIVHPDLIYPGQVFALPAAR
jgi:nucleoid-associated protein YgaU